MYSVYLCVLVCVALCSPSVLDRLNALLEPGGVLTVDERGTIDGDIPVIKPHPDFRYCILYYAGTVVLCP